MGDPGLVTTQSAGLHAILDQARPLGTPLLTATPIPIYRQKWGHKVT